MDKRPKRTHQELEAKIRELETELSEKLTIIEKQSMLKEKLATAVEMAGAIAHELSQPLTNLLVKVELLLERRDETGPYYSDLKVIFEQALRLETLVKKVRNITRYETKEYLPGTKIVDFDKSSTGND